VSRIVSNECLKKKCSAIARMSPAHTEMGSVEVTIQGGLFTVYKSIITMNPFRRKNAGYQPSNWEFPCTNREGPQHTYLVTFNNDLRWVPPKLTLLLLCLVPIIRLVKIFMLASETRFYRTKEHNIWTLYAKVTKELSLVLKQFLPHRHIIDFRDIHMEKMAIEGQSHILGHLIYLVLFHESNTKPKIIIEGCWKKHLPAFRFKIASVLL